MTNPDNVGGLLPCPFCGAEPKLVKCVGYDQGQSSISCANCDVYMMDIHSHVIETWNRRELCRAAPAGGDDHLRRLVGKLDQWRLSMSYNDSYFGEPAGLLKSTVEELARAVGPIYPPKPAPKDPLAGVTIYSATVTLSAAARDGE